MPLTSANKGLPLMTEQEVKPCLVLSQVKPVSLFIAPCFPISSCLINRETGLLRKGYLRKKDALCGHCDFFPTDT